VGKLAIKTYANYLVPFAIDFDQYNRVFALAAKPNGALWRKDAVKANITFDRVVRV
jgi:hypothetical protein